MTNLNGLPAELHISIAEHLDPFTCLNLAIANKRTWAACAPLVRKHKTLWLKYHRFSTRPREPTVWNALNEILDDPSLAWYTQDVDILRDRSLHFDPEMIHVTQFNERTPRPSSDDTTRYVVEAARINNVLGQAMRRYGQALEHWSYECLADDMIITIYLFLLPRLQRLKYAPNSQGWLFKSLKALAYPDGDPINHVSFQHLKKAFITAGCTNQPTSWEWVYYLLSIPSLGSLCAEGIMGAIDGWVGQNDTERPNTPTSNVATIKFGQSSIRTEVFELLFGRLKSLKTFQYENGATGRWDVRYNPRGIVWALEKYCAQSLEHVMLKDGFNRNRADKDYDRFYPTHSFAKFRVLKTVYCDFRDIVNQEDEWPMKGGIALDGSKSMKMSRLLDPRALFPPSLERLHLNDFGNSVPITDKLKMLDRILEAKNSFLTNLSQVYIAFEDELLLMWKRRAAAKGIVYRPLPDDLVMWENVDA